MDGMSRLDYDELNATIRYLMFSVFKVRAGELPEDRAKVKDDATEFFNSLEDEGIVVRDHSSTNGTFVGPVRIHDAVLPPGTALRVGRTTLRVGTGKSVDIELLPEERLGHLLGRSESMRRLMLQVRKVARTEAPSLIVGESGTGKELIASAIHDLGPRTKGPFVTVDCGAMSPNLVASELFGHERGAFTGADRQHIGAFERANGDRKSVV